MTLMPPEQNSGSGPAAMIATLMGSAPGGLAGLATDAVGIKNSGDLFVGVLRSRTVEEALVRRFDLRRVYGNSRWEDACKNLETNTDISQDRKSGIITIRVTDRNPQRAAVIAQEYATELNGVVNKLNTSSAHRERVFLEERLKEVKQDLAESEQEFSQFSSKNAAIDIKEQGKAMVEAAATLQGHLIAAESQLQGLRQIYTENNARVKATEAQVAELRTQLAKLGGAETATSANGSGSDESLYPSIRKLPLLGVPYADLYRRTKVGEAIFEALTQQYELAKVHEAKDTPSVKVLDPAEVPERKSFPPRMLLIFLGTLLAFTGAAILKLAEMRWREVDANNPSRVFLQEVLHTLTPSSSWIRRRSWNLLRIRRWSPRVQSAENKE